MKFAFRPGLVLVLLTLIVTSQNAQALDFTADLSSIKVEAQQGQVINKAFRLTLARTEQRTQFKAHVEDWWRSEDNKKSFYQKPGTLTRSCAPWIKLNPVESAVEPGKSLDVRISIAVPADVKPGGYWCALTVDEVPDPLKIMPDGVGIRFNASLSIGIFVYVGPLDRTTAITSVEIEQNTATIKLRNDGNCPIGFDGRFEFLRSGDEKPTATVVIPRGTLLPEPTRMTSFTVLLPDARTLPSGRYKVRAILDTGLDHFIGVQKEMEIRRETPSLLPVTK